MADYFKSKGDYNPWRNEPGAPANKEELSCRKSFHVFMTDGAWNFSANPAGDGNGISMDGNADGTSKRLPDGVRYDASGTNPDTRLYRDPWGSPQLSTFADLAFHLWSTDLRPDLNDAVLFQQKVTVPENFGSQTLAPYWNPKNNPATWQHLVTYTIGFTAAATTWTGNPVWSGDMYSGSGISGLTGGTTTWESPLCGTSQNEPCSFDAAAGRRAQELWHAALNSRGSYIPSQTADDLGKAFKSILQTIQSESLAGAVSIAANTRRLRKDGLIYLASFRTEPWSGDVSSSDVSAGSIDVEAVPNWSAATLLDAATAGNRVIMTSNGTQGIEFLWTKLDAVQKEALKGSGGTDALGQDRLNYLRGDRNKEASQAGGTLRTRGSRLGTIVNSNLWVNSFSPVYPVDHPGHAEFRRWVRDTNGLGAPRTPVVYVGANDGMLHGFNGNTGAERIAYVPLGAWPKLAAYTSPTYSHQYLVDGNSTRNTVAYSTTESTAPRGWYVDLPALGERLLVHPQLQDGLLVRFETQIPPSSPEEGLCSASIRSEQGYVMVLNGVSGSAAQKAVFYSSDSTLDLASASRVAFGSGDLVRIESGDKQMLLNTQAGGVGKSDNDPLAYRWKLQLVRQKSSAVAVDWRLLP